MRQVVEVLVYKRTLDGMWALPGCMNKNPPQEKLTDIREQICERIFPKKDTKSSTFRKLFLDKLNKIAPFYEVRVTAERAVIMLGGASCG
jgi:hypothetical protein